MIFLCKQRNDIVMEKQCDEEHQKFWTKSWYEQLIQNGILLIGSVLYNTDNKMREKQYKYKQFKQTCLSAILICIMPWLMKPWILRVIWNQNWKDFWNRQRMFDMQVCILIYRHFTILCCRTIKLIRDAILRGMIVETP